MLKKFAMRTVATLAVGLAAVSAGAQTINFGIIATESTQALRTQWQPLIDDMQKETGLKINAFFAPDYAGIIEGMRFNKVQLAWFGNKSAMEAVDRSNGEIFAKVVNADGTEGYYSHLIVHRDSPLRSLDDVLKNGKSLSFGNGDPNSTSGFLLPSFYVFAQNHIDAKTHFKVMRTANHETNAMAVANKQVDVATNNSENLAKLEMAHPDKFKEIRVVWTSPLIPSDPIVVRKDVPESTKAKIKAFFVHYGSNPREKAVLAKMNWSAFKASDDLQLTPIRKLALFVKRTKVEGNSAMSASDKKSSLAEIDAKLAALQ